MVSTITKCPVSGETVLYAFNGFWSELIMDIMKSIIMCVIAQWHHGGCPSGTRSAEFEGLVTLIRVFSRSRAH